MRKIPVELTKRYEEEGWWRPETLGDLIADGLQANPDTGFWVHSAVRPYEGTFADVELRARRLAAGLRARGVQPGDAVAIQLPNWVEAAVSFWASAFLGAVVVPIVHFYGRKELSHIIVHRAAESVHHRRGVRPDDLPAGPVRGRPDRGSGGADERSREEHVHRFDDLLADEPLVGTIAADPASPALIAFTSGTTSQPKGVIHSHQTLGFETRQLLGELPARSRQAADGHTGRTFHRNARRVPDPVLEGASIDLCDVWDPGKVLKLIESDGLSIGGGPPYFVTSLLDHPDCTAEHMSHFKTVGLGGSTVPAAVTRRLADMGIFVFRSYGSSEHPSITGSSRDAPEDKRLFTDGNPRPGVEIRLGPDGEIFSRGPDLCLGYTDDALTERAFDADGWYRTGDVGVLDDDGYLTITDRKADVIIRGGENISALEVEEVLLAMPAVAEAVVVAAPDERLGERAAAVLRVARATTCRPSTTCVSTSRRRVLRSRNGRRNCTGSTTTRAPRAARCRSSSFARTFRADFGLSGGTLLCAASENRILARG